jgi:arginine utilization regulatory protein
LYDIERDRIVESLEKNKKNISKTAEDLGIKRQTLQHKLKKYDI